MALIKLGQMAADIRGSIGGTTFARNRHGAYARNRTKPINPMTPVQTQVRTRFGTQSSSWSGLTQSQRDVWNSAAMFITLLNRLGESYTPTGRQLFLSSNNNLAQAGLAPLTECPANFDPPTGLNIGTALQAQADGATLSIFDLQNGNDGDNLIVFAAPFTSNVITNFQQMWRYIGYFPGYAMADPMVTEFSAVFGTGAIVGQQAAVMLRNLNPVNGVVSPALIVVNNVTPEP